MVESVLYVLVLGWRCAFEQRPHLELLLGRVVLGEQHLLMIRFEAIDPRDEVTNDDAPNYRLEVAEGHPEAPWSGRSTWRIRGAADVTEAINLVLERHRGSPFVLYVEQWDDLRNGIALARILGHEPPASDSGSVAVARGEA